MKRSKFSLSHYKLLTCKMGQLVPVTWFEALPGDTIQQATSALIRCAPLVTPVMHPVHVRFHHWFVPNRILWSSWQDFITGGADGMNASVQPTISISAMNGSSGNNAGVSTLADYLGVPTANSPEALNYNALPFRAYALIFNEFYRDEDLQTPLALSLADGADVTTSTSLQNCAWEKDYLTTARAWAFKGPSVTLPLGSTAPVKGIGVPDGAATAGITANTRQTDGSIMTGQGLAMSALEAKVQTTGNTGNTNTLQIFADLANASAIDINTVRHAFALQRFEEARARYGSRYTEYLRYLGVRSSDARLQRPEYLGGGRNVIQFSEVLQTGGTSAGAQTGVGNLAGHGIAAMRSNRYRRFFEEHGIVMTLMSVRPKTMYSQSTARQLLRGNGAAAGITGILGSKEDYWQRELQHIGQQQIAGKEVDSRIAYNVPWGYQDRYDEYRRFESSVAGAFRAVLDTWHLSREFGSTPGLNSTFVSCVPGTRIFADTSSDNLYVMANHHIQARRLVAREGSSMTF